MHGHLSDLESSGWLGHIRAVLQTTLQIVKYVHSSRCSNILLSSLASNRYVLDGSSVVIHCSDGWDRTAQTCSLAGFMLEPYYRTIRGFIVLVEKEWLHFGHKMSDRNWILDGKAREVSPIFLQFLDCAWQISQQFVLPCIVRMGQGAYCRRELQVPASIRVQRALSCHYSRLSRVFTIWHVFVQFGEGTRRSEGTLTDTPYQIFWAPAYVLVLVADCRVHGICVVFPVLPKRGFPQPLVRHWRACSPGVSVPRTRAPALQGWCRQLENYPQLSTMSNFGTGCRCGQQCTLDSIPRFIRDNRTTTPSFPWRCVLTSTRPL